MNKLFSAFLVANLLTEILAASVLIGGPGGIFEAGSGEMWSMHYGFAALAVATASLWLWPYRYDLQAVTATLGVLLAFHCGIFVSLTAAGDQPAGTVIHAVLAVASIFLFTQRHRWCR